MNEWMNERATRILTIRGRNDVDLTISLTFGQSGRLLDFLSTAELSHETSPNFDILQNRLGDFTLGYHFG